MGTDIHIGVEVKSVQRSDWLWIAILPPPGPLEDGGYVWYNNRNYALFSFLTDVRYGSSIVGAALPLRGLPEDRDTLGRYGSWYQVGRTGPPSIKFRIPTIDYDGKDSEHDWYFGDYGYTWMTVGELLALPWDEAKTDWEPPKTLREQCSYFIEWLEELRYLYGADTCRVIWGYDS